MEKKSKDEEFVIEYYDGKFFQRFPGHYYDGSEVFNRFKIEDGILLMADVDYMIAERRDKGERAILDLNDICPYLWMKQQNLSQISSWAFAGGGCYFEHESIYAAKAARGWGLDLLIIPDSVKILEDDAFAGIAVKTLVIPDSLAARSCCTRSGGVETLIVRKSWSKDGIKFSPDSFGSLIVDTEGPLRTIIVVDREIGEEERNLIKDEYKKAGFKRVGIKVIEEKESVLDNIDEWKVRADKYNSDEYSGEEKKSFEGCCLVQ